MVVDSASTATGAVLTLRFRLRQGLEWLEPILITPANLLCVSGNGCYNFCSLRTHRALTVSTNTSQIAEPECLPSQFHLSESLAVSPLLESQGPNLELNDGFVREASTDLPCSMKNVDQLDEGERYALNCDGHEQPESTCSGSLGLPLFDEPRDSKAWESNRRRIYCDPRLLEEETQVSDFAELVSAQQDSHRLSHILYSQTASQQHDKSEPLLVVIKQECCKTVRDFGDIIQRWHSRKKSAFNLSSSTIGSPLEIKQESVEPSTAYIDPLESGNADPLTATKQKPSEAVLFDDIVQRWHNRKRISLPAVTDPRSSPDTGIHKKLKPTSEKTVELGTLELRQLQDQPMESSTIIEQENCSILGDECDGPLPDVLAPGSDSETTEEDIDGNTDGILTDDCCDSSLSQRRLTYSCSKDMKSFWQPESAKNHEVERKFSCPRKYRPGGRQRTIDTWIK